MTGPVGLLVFLVAGEPSGDVLGARLMSGLEELARASGEDVRFAGVGGPMMAARGLESLFPMADLTVMGLAEVIPRLPNLLRRIRETVAAVERLRPSVVVTIDAPDFCFRVARRLRGRGIPLVHYVAPTVWAWRPGRARKIAGFLDHLLALLPFEPPYFEREGLPCTFVGHPVVESGLDRGDGLGFRARHGMTGAGPVACVLPGSRGSETSRLLPIFSAALEILARSHPGLEAVVPTVATVAAGVRSAVESWPVRVTVIEGPEEKADAFAASDVALAASGTVALELALARVPAVIAYRVNPVSAWIGRRLIKVRYVTLVNLVLDRDAVPELLQEQCTPDRLAAATSRLLDDEMARREQQVLATEALRHLGLGGPSPGERGARVVWELARGGMARP